MVAALQMATKAVLGMETTDKVKLAFLRNMSRSIEDNWED
jgi:hypothetical protein